MASQVKDIFSSKVSTMWMKSGTRVVAGTTVSGLRMRSFSQSAKKASV